MKYSALLFSSQKTFCYPLFFLLWSMSCRPKENKMVLPDLRPNFSAILHQRDSTLSLDSFYFVSIDTMNTRKALTHQRYAFLHILERINGQLDSVNKGNQPLSTSELETKNYLQGEKAYVGKEIDSFNLLIAHADSTAPVGYRALYKVTVTKKGEFTISDTVPYSITLNMQVSDWDRNIEKNIDSLAVGKQGRSALGK